MSPGTQARPTGCRSRGTEPPKARRPLRVVYRALSLVGPVAYACAGAGPGNVAAAPPRPGSLITQEAIAASGAKTAWDALKRTVPYVHLRENRGRPARITRRGPASIYLDDQVRLMVDNVRVYDLQVLDQMPASDIVTIEVQRARCHHPLRR